MTVDWDSAVFRHEQVIFAICDGMARGGVAPDQVKEVLGDELLRLSNFLEGASGDFDTVLSGFFAGYGRALAAKNGYDFWVDPEQWMGKAVDMWSRLFMVVPRGTLIRKRPAFRAGLFCREALGG